MSQSLNSFPMLCVWKECTQRYHKLNSSVGLWRTILFQCNTKSVSCQCFKSAPGHIFSIAHDHILGRPLNLSTSNLGMAILTHDTACPSSAAWCAKYYNRKSHKRPNYSAKLQRLRWPNFVAVKLLFEDFIYLQYWCVQDGSPRNPRPETTASRSHDRVCTSMLWASHSSTLYISFRCSVSKGRSHSFPLPISCL